MADMADLLVDHETGMLTEEECQALEDSGMLDGFEKLGAEVEARHRRGKLSTKRSRKRKKKGKEGARHKAKT